MLAGTSTTEHGTSTQAEDEIWRISTSYLERVENHPNVEAKQLHIHPDIEED